MYRNLSNTAPSPFFASVLKFCFGLILTSIFASGVVHAQSSPPPSEKGFDIEAAKTHLSNYQRTLELLAKIETFIASTDVNTPVTSRIELDLWKLRALGDISDTQLTADFAYQIYEKYKREEYQTDIQYGDMMQQIVQAVAKTGQLDLAFEIVQSLRESVYQNPSVYLDFAIEKSLMEIYIETFDYKRALEVELSILNNSDYWEIEKVRLWRPSLHTEIAFLYNRLGNGEKALKYLELGDASLSGREWNPSDLLKAKTLNWGNRGRAYLLTGQYDLVEPVGQRVLQVGKQLQQNYLIALSYRLLGSAAYNLGDYEKARPLLKDGITLSETHGIGTMQKFLYKDYALCLEALGEHKEAVYWLRKHLALEIQAQEQAADARDALSDAEFNAMASHQEIRHLKHENINQRRVAERDKRVRNLLVVTVLSLTMGGGVLACLIVYMRRAQKKLIASEHKAQIANKAKSEFLANMSHEIRTPMNGVLGMAQVLEKTSLSDKQRFYVDVMKRSGENLLFIINDILDFSKLEADKLTLNPEAHNLEQTMHDVVTLLSPRAEEKGLELRIHYDPNLSKNFIFDKERLRQIITNLVGNALKFTKEGYVKLSVTERIKGGSRMIRIRVADTGIGIADDKLAVVFEKFAQAESSTTRTHGGTGLGLSISRRLSEAMNGKLEATSAIGTGSTFTLELPLEVAKTPSNQNEVVPTPLPLDITPLQTALPCPASRPRQASNKHIEILIAEDNEAQIKLMQNLLSHPRIKLTFATNGKEAVKAYKSNFFNLIFMDISMPIMDGVAATKVIREFEAIDDLPRTPIVCLSAHAMAWQKEKFYRTEIDDYLSKPVNKEQLLEAMHLWLRPRQSAA